METMTSVIAPLGLSRCVCLCIDLPLRSNAMKQKEKQKVLCIYMWIVCSKLYNNGGDLYLSMKVFTYCLGQIKMLLLFFFFFYLHCS